jgi:hypothetical protein
MFDVDRYASRFVEEFLARIGAEMAGEFKGRDVARLHKCALKKCEGKTRWELVECIVDKMHEIYEKAKSKGVEETLREETCVGI